MHARRRIRAPGSFYRGTCGGVPRRTIHCVFHGVFVARHTRNYAPRTHTPRHAVTCAVARLSVHFARTCEGVLPCKRVPDVPDDAGSKHTSGMPSVFACLGRKVPAMAARVTGAFASPKRPSKKVFVRHGASLRTLSCMTLATQLLFLFRLTLDVSRTPLRVFSCFCTWPVPRTGGKIRGHRVPGFARQRCWIVRRACARVAPHRRSSLPSPRSRCCGFLARSVVRAASVSCSYILQQPGMCSKR